MSSNLTLTPEEYEHYSRHLLLADFGLERQLRLKAARVLLVGAGGLGCPAGMYLAAAGVGTIGVADFDQVERSNLQRQIAHRADEVGRAKTDSLIDAMRALNPLPEYRAHPYRLNAENVLETVTGYDLVLDGSDNFATRYLLVDACHLTNTPLLQGAVYAYEARLSLFIPGSGPCYRCVFREPPEKNALRPCAEAGVLGVTPGAAGVMMATEAIKYLSGFPSSIQGVMLVYQLLSQSIRRIALSWDRECPLCGEHPTIRTVRETVVACPTQAGNVDADCTLTPSEALRFLADGAIPLDVRELFEYQVERMPDALHLPLSTLTGGELPPVDAKNAPILVYCRQGYRSLEATTQLRQQGYSRAFSLSGGLNTWRGPLERPPLQPGKLS